jgi:hypothetical protein
MRIAAGLMTVVGAVGLLVGSSATPVSAQVVVGDVDVVTFSGTAVASPAIPLIGGDGTYTFSTSSNGIGGTPGQCLGASADTDIALGTTSGDADIAPCTITSSGTYHSIVCGTGTAGGTATITEGGDGVAGNKNPSDVYDVTYSIQFVAGIGVLTGNATERGDVEASPVVGIVALDPVSVGLCPLTTFTITGVAASTI